MCQSRPATGLRTGCEIPVLEVALPDSATPSRLEPPSDSRTVPGTERDPDIVSRSHLRWSPQPSRPPGGRRCHSLPRRSTGERVAANPMVLRVAVTLAANRTSAIQAARGHAFVSDQTGGAGDWNRTRTDLRPAEFKFWLERPLVAAAVHGDVARGPSCPPVAAWHRHRTLELSSLRCSACRGSR